MDSIEAQHKPTQPSADDDDYNHLSEIEGIKCEPLAEAEQSDKSLKPHKIFKMIIIGDTGKSLQHFTYPLRNWQIVFAQAADVQQVYGRSRRDSRR